MTLTQADLQAIGTLMDKKLERMVTKEDLENARMDLYNELAYQYKENDKRLTKLEGVGGKIDTLLLQSDNTALLLQLTNRQAEELDALKLEVREIQSRLA